MKAKITKDNIDAKFRAKLAAQSLRFGDVEQINILRAWRQEIDRFEEEEEARKNPGPVIRWRVRYSWRVSWRENDEQYVEASTAEEAEEKIDERLGYLDDFQIEYAEAAPEKKRA